uniref:Uncharacterized protein n=1 Tax=Arundo donax TaxID=35708 RepID=A0A0A9FYA8_ARUDO
MFTSLPTVLELQISQDAFMCKSQFNRKILAPENTATNPEYHAQIGITNSFILRIPFIGS